MTDIVYDVETYPNVFTLSAEHSDLPIKWQFEISDYRDDYNLILEWCKELVVMKARMVGFNNIGFDYPILHMLLGKRCKAIDLYNKAQALIHGDKFNGIVYPSDRLIPQIDLFKIHHFDNKARTTSLKALEFQMRMDNISDLPFPIGSTLDQEQIVLLKAYNAHDVHATKLFYHHSLEQIRFREQLTETNGRDFMNDNDTKIGASIFQQALESKGYECYRYGPDGRVPKQTHRDRINLHECIPQWVQFTHPEFQRIKEWFNSQVITETKGVFTDVIAHVGGLDYIYGTGGLHASVENSIFLADDEWMIYDMDVTSLYPSIAIEHGHYPEHIGPGFVDVYRALREKRIGYKKGTAENAMLKLALNGVYGKSNDKYSIFYDPLFTMKITLGGQMMISLLVERLYFQGFRIIQVNTDGITIYAKRSEMEGINGICRQWEKETKLSLEYAEYSKMVIRDVNNYLAVKTNGEVKRKGAYEYDKEWYQDSSASVVAKVAEQHLVHGKSIEWSISEADFMDFMIRVRVPRNSKLIYVEDGKQRQVENTMRYYLSTEGGTLLKVMPPLKGKTENRWFDVQKGWKVCLCNNMDHATLPIDYQWYIEEAYKLCLKNK